MNPYRTCPESLEPPLRLPRFPRGALAAIPLVLLLTTAAAASIAASRGQVEIAPLALTHVLKKKPAPPPRHRDARPPPPPLAAWIVTAEHDPVKVLAHAHAIESLGVDLTVIDVPLARPLVREATRLEELWPRRSRPVFDAQHRLAGIELRGIERDSPLRVAGFSDGDELLGVNGYDLASVTDLDLAAVQRRGFAVLEVARAGHRVAIALRWG